MNKIKKISKLFVALLIVSCGVSMVNASSKVVGGLVSISQNSNHKLPISDCSYSYFFGSAIATTQPNSGAYFEYNLKRVTAVIPLIGEIEENIDTRAITNLSTSSYSSTSYIGVSQTGNYNSYFKIRNSSYYGNIQTTNSTSSTLDI